jgi:hypothetical protein
MKPDNAASSSSTGEASGTKPPALQTPPDKLTESEYLAQQAEAAKLAMASAWAQVKERLAQGASPQAWAKEHPWVAVSAAAVAGFVAASAIIPSKEEQTLKKLAAIERALNPALQRAEHAEGNGHGKKAPASFLTTLLHEALAIARPAIVSLMTAGLGGMSQPRNEASDSDTNDGGSTGGT